MRSIKGLRPSNAQPFVDIRTIVAIVLASATRTIVTIALAIRTAVASEFLGPCRARRTAGVLTVMVIGPSPIDSS